jgi:hypothetical protein
MPILKIDPTHTEQGTELSCVLHYGTEKTARFVIEAASTPEPEADGFKRELQAFAQALEKAIATEGSLRIRPRR